MIRGMASSYSSIRRSDDDIYDATPTPDEQRLAGNAIPGDASISPSPTASTSSDKENSSYHGAKDKGKGRAMPPPKLPTPLSDSDRTGKRKRTEDRDNAAGPQNRRRRTVEQEEVDSDDDFDASYDPEQDVEERRRLRKSMRDLAKDLNDNRGEYLHAESTGLIDTLNRANQLASAVKQTTDATIDSRILVTASDLAYRKTVQLTVGESVQGVDMDEFISKCITFMRQADGGILDGPQAQPSNTQQRRRRHNHNDDSDDGGGDEGDMLNWERLGRFSCLQHNARPSVPGFLLGPLSLEKRARKATQRNPGLRVNNLKQTQPEVITADDLEKSETNLTILCTRILARLKKMQHDREAAVESEATEDMTEAEIRVLMDKHGVHAKGGVDLFRFVVNPYSFGQTVENMFYVSFLIRDGKAGITINDDGLPAVGKLST
jgi:hypothetical protein